MMWFGHRISRESETLQIKSSVCHTAHIQHHIGPLRIIELRLSVATTMITDPSLRVKLFEDQVY